VWQKKVSTIQKQISNIMVQYASSILRLKTFDTCSIQNSDYKVREIKELPWRLLEWAHQDCLHCWTPENKTHCNILHFISVHETTKIQENKKSHNDPKIQ